MAIGYFLNKSFERPFTFLCSHFLSFATWNFHLDSRSHVAIEESLHCIGHWRSKKNAQPSSACNCLMRPIGMSVKKQLNNFNWPVLQAIVVCSLTCPNLTLVCCALKRDKRRKFQYLLEESISELVIVLMQSCNPDQSRLIHVRC